MVRIMSFLNVHAGPWRGVAFLVGADAPESTPAGCDSLLWRHDGTARLGGGLERAQAQVLIDESVTPDQPQRSRPEPFVIRDVTTSIAGEGFVFAGELFGQQGSIEADTGIVLAQITLAPDTEVAIAINNCFEYALIAVDQELYLDRRPVPERSVGELPAGQKFIGVENRTSHIAHGLIVGGLPTDAAAEDCEEDSEH